MQSFVLFRVYTSAPRRFACSCRGEECLQPYKLEWYEIMISRFCQVDTQVSKMSPCEGLYKHDLYRGHVVHYCLGPTGGHQIRQQTKI